MIKKKIVAGIISAALVVSLTPSTVLAQEVQTAQIEDFAPQVLSEQAAVTLKSKGAKFDLKKGKVLNTSLFIRGAGNIPYNVKLNSAKITDSQKQEGYKHAELSITFKSKKNLTTAQKKKIMAAWKKICKTDLNTPSVVLDKRILSYYRFFIVDYVTGKNLLDPNSKANVSIERQWSGGNYAGYRDKSNWWFRIAMKENLTVNIEYPASCKNLCFGAGADKWTNYDMSKYDASFNGSNTYMEKGKKKKVKSFAATYYQTNFLKKARNNYHFIKLS